MPDQSRDLLVTLALTALNVDQLEKVDTLLDKLKTKDGDSIREQIKIEFPGGERVLSALEKIGLLSEESFNLLIKKMQSAEGETGGLTRELNDLRSTIQAFNADIKELETLQSSIGSITSSTSDARQAAVSESIIAANKKFRLDSKEGGDVTEQINTALTERKSVLDALQARYTSLSSVQRTFTAEQGESISLNEILNQVDKRRLSLLDRQQTEIRELRAEIDRMNQAMSRTTRVAVPDLEKSFAQLSAELSGVTAQLARIGQARKEPSTPKEPKPRQSLVQSYLSRGAKDGGGLFSGVLGRASFATARLAFYLVAARILFSIQNALAAAGRNAVDFEKALAEIQGVLPSKSQMEALQIGQAAIRTATDYSLALNDAAESAKIFAQTGKNASQIAEAIGASAAAVRGANLDIQQAREFVIAIERITEGEIGAYEILDRISRVEARRAITASDLATGIQRIGPVVHALRGDMQGLVDDIDVAAGALTSIVERTRVSGQAAATSLKFVLSRFGNPQVVKQIQSLSQVKLAREGGRELRPFVEILQEISAVYKELQATGQSGRAFQLLSILGGSRQIQATSALLENFSKDTLQTARLASLAFNDATERTAIALDTVSAKASKVSASWANLSDATINSVLVNGTVKGSLEGLSYILTKIADGTRFLDDVLKATGVNLTNIFGGDAGKYRVDFIDLKNIDINKIPKLKAFNEAAADANLSSNELLTNITNIASALEEGLNVRTGLSLPELLKQLDDVATGDKFRDLHVVFGTQLADSLATVLPQFQDFKTKLEDTQDPAEKAIINNERLAAAYDLLSNAAFVSNAVLASNIEKLKNSVTSLVDQFSTDIRKPIEQSSDLFNKVFFHSGLKNNFSAFTNSLTAAKDKFSTDFLGINRDLKYLVGSFFEATNASEEWNKSLQIAFDRGPNKDSFKTALDIFSQRIVNDTVNREQVISSLTEKLNNVLIGNNAPGFEALSSGAKGELFISNFTKLVSEAGDRLLKSGRLAGEARQNLVDFINALNAPGARSADFLKTVERSLSSVRSKILELLTTYTIAVTSNNELAQSYRQVGIYFDKQTANLTAAKTLFEGLSKIQNDLRKEIVLTDKTFGSLLDNIALNFKDKGKNITAALLKSAIDEQTQNIEGVSGEQSQKITDARAKLIAYRQELALLSNDTLVDIFGTSKEAATFLDLFDTAIEESGKSAKDALISFAALRQAILNVVGARSADIYNKQIDLQYIRAQSKAIQDQVQLERSISDSRFGDSVSSARTRSQAIGRVLAQYNKLTPSIKNQLNLENQIYNLEQARINKNYKIAVQAAQDIYQNKKREIERDKESLDVGEARVALKQAELEYDAQIKKATDSRTQEQIKAQLALSQGVESIKYDLLSTAYTDFSKQVQQNVDNAVSGFKTLLTDINTFKNGKGIDTVLRPIGSTFVSRISENFIQGLVDTNSEGFFANLGRVFGESTESRLANRFKEAANLAGHDIASQFSTAGELVAQRLAAAMGTTLPNVPAGTSTTAIHKKVGAQLTRKQQIEALIGSVGGGLLGDAIGSSASSELGAQLGTTIGTFIAPGIGSLLGGLAGGALGGLFGGDEESKQQTQALRRIEQNTGRSADVLELEKRFLDVARGAVNVPSTFNIPQYTPGSTGSQVIVQQRNVISPTIEIHGVQNAEETVKIIKENLSPIIVNELKKIGY